MFTGLIEDVGKLVSFTQMGHAGKLVIETRLPVEEIKNGDSVAVNGVCLTVERITAQQLQFHCLAETMSRTNLGALRPGDCVNLERALAAGSRMGGHIVQGHVDYCGKVVSAGAQGADFRLEVSLPAEYRAEVVRKGSVALNGVSLTVAAMTEESFTICLIPTTLEHTNLRFLKSGAPINVETDIVGKYIAAQLNRVNGGGSITMDTLLKAGF